MGDDYAAVGAGALKIKGAKIKKKKTTTKKKATDLEKNLSEPRQTDPREAGDEGERDRDEAPTTKTESERRHAEARKKRLLQMTQASGSRHGLLKTHKERVEDLNTYLSRLSEHHDMPKIGPG